MRIIFGTDYFGKALYQKLEELLEQFTYHLQCSYTVKRQATKNKR